MPTSIPGTLKHTTARDVTIAKPARYTQTGEVLPNYQPLAQYDSLENLKLRIDLHDRYSKRQVNWHRWVYDHIHALPTPHVLEVGSGVGRLWQASLPDWNPDWHVVLTDQSATMLQSCVQIADTTAAPKFTTRRSTVENLPFEDDSFDLVIANHMLYHVEDLTVALESVLRVLRAEGYFVVATNGSNHLLELELAMCKFNTAWSESDLQPFMFTEAYQALAERFNSVRFIKFVDELLIDDPESAVGYALSQPEHGSSSAFDVEGFRTFATDMIRARGVWNVGIEMGLFICSFGPKSLAP